MISEPGGPKSNHQEPRGSTADCLTLIPKEIWKKSNPQELAGSTYDRLTFLLNIFQLRTQNKITAPYMINTY